MKYQLAEKLFFNEACLGLLSINFKIDIFCIAFLLFIDRKIKYSRQKSYFELFVLKMLNFEIIFMHINKSLIETIVI